MYTAPLKDMQFVINELIDIDTLASYPNFEDVSPDLMETILSEAGKVASEVLAPLNKIGDQQGSHLKDGKVVVPDGFTEAFKLFSESGWMSVDQVTEFDGQGLPHLVQCAVSEMWHASNMAFTLCPLLTNGAVEAIYAHGSDSLKQTYLPNMIAGKWTGTMNLTEPQAGSDLAAVRTKATPDGDSYRIKGQKIYITWGDHEMTENIIHLVLARLPDAPEGVKGISLFLVPKYLLNEDGSIGERNDAKPVSLEHKMGINASPTCVMSFGDNDGAIGYLVGEENNGLACMFTMMNLARLAVGMEGIGLSEGAYQVAVAYAKERKQGFAPGHEGRVAIIEHADVRRMLMQMRAFTEASRALGYTAAAAHDHAHNSPDEAVRAKQQKRIDLLIPITKGWCTEIAQEVSSIAVQVHGGMGFIEETGVAQYMRDARILPIYEGTTGIQALDLMGRKLMRDSGEGMIDLLEELKAFNTELQNQDDATFASIKTQFNTALNAAMESTEWVLTNAKSDPNLAGAVGVNMLMMMGTTLGGYLLAKGAVAAQKHISSGSDNEFYNNKISVATFYAEQILPRSLAYATSVKAGHKAVMSLSTDSF
ncbi:MAG: alkylation response protein AidB-like acyl-CoA dehydrogenase [Cocleimonas sp.]|jgi:alkylation response protein AidB-like acyl-CoA dehydrogenase